MTVPTHTSLLFVLVSTILAAIPAAAQSDLSGVWEPIPEASVLNVSPTALPPGAPPPQPAPRTVALTISQQSGQVIVERRLAANGAEEVRRFTYAIGGAASVNQNGPIQLTTTAAWEGGTLVLTSNAAMEGRQLGSMREQYAVVNGELVVESTRQGPAGVSTSRDVHRRR